MKKLNLLLIILILNTSCINNDNKNRVNDLYEIVPSKTIISFDIDKKVNLIRSSISINEFDNLRVLSAISYNNYLMVYNFDNKQLIKLIKYHSEGPNGVGNFFGHKLINIDSVYFSSSMTQRLYLANLKGERLQAIDFSKSTDGSIPLHTFVESRSPLICNNGKIFLMQYSMDMNYDKSICLEVDTLKKTVVSLPMSYPSIFKKNEERSILGTSRIMVNDKFIYSFGPDHTIYTTKDHNKTEKHLAKSKYIDVIKPYPPRSSWEEQRLKYPEYSSIHYDKYNKVYYRFAFAGMETTTKDDLSLLGRYRPQFSIIILDSTFQKIGETLMQKNTYDEYQYFVTKEGLWLSENNPSNPNYSEDKLTFRLMELKKMEN